MRIGFSCLWLSLVCLSCKGGDEKPAPASASPEAQAPAEDEPARPDPAAVYADVRTRTAAARTADDFVAIAGACARLEIDHPAQAGTPEFTAACRVGPARAQARRAIAETTADSMSPHCLAAATRLEELVEDDIETAASSALLAELHKACGTDVEEDEEELGED